MSGDMGSIDLTPVVSALTSAVTPSNIISVFATGVTVSLGLVLAWFRCKMGISVNLLKQCAVGRG